MDTAVMNQTIWAVQDFILDAVKNDINNIVSKKAATQIKNSGIVGHTVLREFLGKSWTNRIQTALELRKLEDESKSRKNGDRISLDPFFVLWGKHGKRHPYPTMS